MPLFEVVGNGFKLLPEQIGVTVLNVGITGLFTVIVNVVVVAHNPAVGVNVYVVVAALFGAGDQVPVIPLLDVVGNGLRISPMQMGAIAVNVGNALLLTVTVSVVVVAHNPVVGVKT